ncbi:MAG: gliding motility protein GldM [Bacteroidetes bacterium]|nr:gliding motility protein GldM [Bacteroidota bacterium]
MAGYKETPRQKMISMMYLVLTALLALNVSKQMLDAFLVVNEGMESTIEGFSNKIDNVYTEFNKQYKLNPNKVEPFWLGAQEAKTLSEELVAFIDSVKYALIIQSAKNIETIEQAMSTPLSQVKNKDKYTEPTRFFFGRSVDGSTGLSGEIKRRINAYRSAMLNLINEDEDSDRLGLITKGPYYDANGQQQTWEQHNFYYTILAADVTILNKLEGEVQGAEFDVINHLSSSITARDFKFDDIAAKVISSNSYILKGQRYEAEVFVAAYDTKQDPEVYILQGVDEINANNFSRAAQLQGEDGVVKLNFTTNREGLQKYAGLIRILNPDGEAVDYPFKNEYIVAPPSLTVAATKMNVFYVGVENPVSISVPGMADELIQPEISVGTLRKNPNGSDWIVEMERGTTEAVISATANHEGTRINMGSRQFRVKRVPDPVAEIARQKEGSIDKNTLMAASAIIPSMKDFEFDLNFMINSFNMATVVNGDWISKSTRGNRLSSEMLGLIKSSKRGQKFFFENIQASGPDGTTRTLNTVNFTIQ